MQRYDVIVVGLGAIGSAAAMEMAKQGLTVVGLDRFKPPHERGSSNGESRIIREAYFEHPLYVPLVQHAYRKWNELEQHTGQRLLLHTGGVMIGVSDGALVRGARHSAIQHALPFEELPAPELRRRFPIFRVPDDYVGIWEPKAGILFAERCVETLLHAARENGAQLHLGEPALSWEVRSSGVHVRSSVRDYRGDRLLLAAGAWMSELLHDLTLPLLVERQVAFWFDPHADEDAFDADRCPVYLVEHEPGRLWYGFPQLGSGIKVALHHQGRTAAPDQIHPVESADEQRMRDVLSRFLPCANGRLRKAQACIYTNTPDDHFVIDFHPQHPQVLLASVCSGHGFKFASAMGEILAGLLTTGGSRFDLEPFALSRFRSHRTIGSDRRP